MAAAREAAMREKEEEKLKRYLGFRLIDDFDPLAQTHWLIFDPPYDELDDHPPPGPDDDSFRCIVRRGEADFLTDSRVRGDCRHRIIRYGEWPDECQFVIKRLWHKAFLLEEKDRGRKTRCKKLEFSLYALLVVPLPLLFLLGRIFQIAPDQFDRILHYYGYLATGLIGALIGSWLTSGRDNL